MTTTVYVCTMAGRKGKWSRYVFPFAIEAFAQLGNALYIRAGDSIVRVSEDATTDTYNYASIPDRTVLSAKWDASGADGSRTLLYVNREAPTKTVASTAALPWASGVSAMYVGCNDTYSPCELHLESLLIYAGALSDADRLAVEWAL